MTLKKEIKVLKAENQLLREHAHVPTDPKSSRGKDGQGNGETSTTIFPRALTYFEACNLIG